MARNNARKVVFPEKACPYARELAKRSKAFRLQISSRGETDVDDGYQVDPFGELEEKTKVPGLTQRFPDRVLVMTSENCFANCRHCTRRGILGKKKIVDTDEALDSCVKYVLRHPKVRDVLLSGGDALVLSDEKVLKFAEAFAKLDQIDIVRLCTRAPCVNPQRITAKLATKLSKLKKIWVNTQFNSADEVTSQAIRACNEFISRGIPVSCQTVLLKGVNDTPKKMLALLKALSAAKIRPYYVFMCDDVAGIDRFRVPIEKARQIEAFCARNIGGLSMPRFVRDIASAKRKEPI